MKGLKELEHLRLRFLKKAAECERVAFANRPDEFGGADDETYKRSLQAEAGRWAWNEAETMLKSVIKKLSKETGQ